VGLCCEEVGEEVKIPSRIKIKNKVVYELVWVDEFADPDTLGECRPWASQIAIKNGQSDKQEMKTFLHEMLHALCEERGIKVSHRAIYQLEDALFYILFHNDWGKK
jgi:hypothetical protein